MKVFRFIQYHLKKVDFGVFCLFLAGGKEREPQHEEYLRWTQCDG